MMIREGQLKDAADIAKLLIRTWQQAYRGIFPTTFLRGLKASDQQKRHEKYLELKEVSYLLLREKEELYGFISFGPPRDKAMKGTIEIYAFYVSPEYQGKGWGTHLFQAFQSKSGIQKVSVEVFKSNPFLKFYMKKGFVPSVEGVIDIGGSPASYFICEWCPSSSDGH